MKKLIKALAPLAVGTLVGLFAVANILTASATPAAPTPPDPTEVSECQSIQADLDGAYADLDELVTAVSADASQIEAILEQIDTEIFGGDPSMMTADLDGQVADGYLLSGSACEDSANGFAYYSSFSYEGILYCFEDRDMWIGIAPDYFNFFDHFIEMLLEVNPDEASQLGTIRDGMLPLLDDDEPTLVNSIVEYLAEIAGISLDLGDCEELYMPTDEEDGEVECPNCQVIADEISAAFDDLASLEEDADTLESQINDIEDQLDDLWDQMEELEKLQDEFRQMVLDAGGKVDSDCDGFKPQSGQAWGIAHNFGDVQWCFTDEGQIEDMIKNLDDYWKDHSSSHLPSAEALNTQIDQLVADYTTTLDDYAAVLDLIDDEYTAIDLLMQELKDCIEELEDLQLQDECLDEDINSLRKAYNAANTALGEPYKPLTDPWTFDDTDDHWAEDFIKELFEGGIISGDEGTNDFRPDDNINRAEAAKIVTKANGDKEEAVTDSSPDITPDVKKDDWFYPFVKTSYDNGYFSGYKDGTFGPGNPILRSEAAAVILRVLGFDVPEYDSYSFPDITGDEWYADYAEKAYKCGIFQGRTVGDEQHFAGGESITRAEFAKIIDIAIYDPLTEDQCE